jgi:single-stranded-DNA-specific exonuclease
MSREAGEAQALAEELNTANRQRQASTRETVESARLKAVGTGEVPELLAACAPEFSIGIAGLAAARLTEEYYRPAVVAQWGEQTTRGSARSIPEFHILAALDSCADLLLEFGGHSAAAGFTVRTADLEALLGRLSVLAGEALRGKDVVPRQSVDAIVELPELGFPLLGLLDAIEPCGYGNPTPVFAAQDARVLQSRSVGGDGSHLKLTLSQGRRSFDAIAFRRGDLAGHMPRRVDVAFTLERNVYLGYESIQLNIQDVRPAGQGDWAEE